MDAINLPHGDVARAEERDIGREDVARAEERDIGREDVARAEERDIGREESVLANTSQYIQTAGVFPFMELPTELRLKVYPHLLICDEEITVITADGSQDSVRETATPRPSTFILQTCKQINEEGTPILYSQNKFAIYLALDPMPASSLAQCFLLTNLRWSSISQLMTLSFLSNRKSLPTPTGNIPVHIRTAFTCTGADILARFDPQDIWQSPDGPDEYMARGLSNWISNQVMRTILMSFERELESMISSDLGVAVGAVNGDNSA